MSGSAREVLRSAPDLASLGDRSVERILERAALTQLTEGQVLFEAGSQGVAAYLLLSARVELRSRLWTQALATTGPGEWVGDMALVDPGRRSATATVVQAGQALVMEADDLDDLIWEDGGELLQVLRAILERRLEHTLGQVEVLLHTADQRQHSVEPVEQEVWTLVHGGCR